MQEADTFDKVSKNQIKFRIGSLNRLLLSNLSENITFKCPANI